MKTDRPLVVRAIGLTKRYPSGAVRKPPCAR